MVLFLFYDDMKVFSILYSPDLKKRTTVKQFKGPHECLNNTNIDNNPGKLAESLKEKKMDIFYDVALQLSRVLDVFPPMLCAENDSHLYKDSET